MVTSDLVLVATLVLYIRPTSARPLVPELHKYRWVEIKLLAKRVHTMVYCSAQNAMRS